MLWKRARVCACKVEAFSLGEITAIVGLKMIGGRIFVKIYSAENEGNDNKVRNVIVSVFFVVRTFDRSSPSALLALTLFDSSRQI